MIICSDRHQRKRDLTFVAIVLSACNVFSQQSLKLWYNQPAREFLENALAIGNGMYGKTARKRHKSKGGFEISELKWKGGKIEKVKIKSHFGGNLRI